MAKRKSKNLVLDYYIYTATNRKNGKVYVGSTSYSMSYRRNILHWQARRTQMTHAIAVALRKDEKAFDWATVDHIRGKLADAEALEQKWIDKLNSMVPHGYNERKGGRSGTHGDSSKAKKSVSQSKAWENMTEKQKEAWRKQRQVSGRKKSVRKKISKSAKERWADPVWRAKTMEKMKGAKARKRAERESQI